MDSLLKRTRFAHGLSIEEAAKNLGIPSGYLSQIENGHRLISAERATQIAKMYHQKRIDLFKPIRYATREAGTLSLD